MTTVSVLDRAAPRELSIAKSAAIDSLGRQLSQRFGFSADLALAIANSVVDPQDARNKLDRLVSHTLAGGQEVVGFETLAWSIAICPYPANPRFFLLRRYQVASPAELVESPLLPEPDSGGLPLLHFDAANAEQLREALKTESLNLLGQTPWRDSVRRQGVRQAVDLMLVRVAHRDGRPPATALASIDGSTRIFLCQEGLRIEDPAGAIYRYADNRSRLHTDISRVLRLRERPLENISEDELAALNALAVPAFIIVGIRSPEGRRFTALDAADDLLEDAHINTPVPWPKLGINGQAANRVLRALRDESAIEEDAYGWFMGHRNAPNGEGPDVRAALLAHELLPEHYLIGRHFRAESGKGGFRSTNKGELIAELCMRAFHPRPEGRMADGLASVYGRALMHPLLQQPNRWSVTDRDPEAIVESALGELADDEGIGPNCLELGVLGLYWLVQKRAFRRELQTQSQRARERQVAPDDDDDEQDADNRAPHRVLDDLMQSRHGLRQLYQAVVDGRGGKAQIRAVNEAGEIIMVSSTAGVQRTREQPLTSAGLRQIVASDGGPHHRDGDVPTAISPNPTQQFRNQFHRLVRAVEDLTALVSVAEDISLATGEPAWREVGAPMSMVNHVSGSLTGVMVRLGAWGAAYNGELTIAQTGTETAEPAAPSDVRVMQSGFEVRRLSQSAVEVRVGAVSNWYARVTDQGHTKGKRVEVFDGRGAAPLARLRTQHGVHAGDANELAGHLLLTHGLGNDLPRYARSILTEADRAAYPTIRPDADQ